MRLDKVDDAFLDRGPDALATVATCGRAFALAWLHLAELCHVLDRYDDVDVDGLRGRRLHDRHRAGAAEEAGDLVDRPDRCGQSDPLRGCVEQGIESFEREPKMCAALAAGNGVHLVDDDCFDTAQRLAGLRGEQQEQRLGCGDEDVARSPGESASLLGRRVAGAHGDADVMHLLAEPCRGMTDSGERGAQVALDVDGQRLQGGDIQDAAAVPGIGGRRRGQQAVEGVEEGSQRLAGSGWRDDQCVLAAADRLPGADLSRGRLGEGRVEPAPGRRGEALRGRHRSIVAPVTDKNSGRRS